MPTTSAPTFAAGNAVVPSPHPRSSTLSPFVIPSRCTSASPLSRMVKAMRVKSPFSQSALFGFIGEHFAFYLLLSTFIFDIPTVSLSSHERSPPEYRREMPNFPLCSDCFRDEGLRLDSEQIGISEKSRWKLTTDHVATLARRFFVWGTLQRCDYGAAPLVVFNQHKSTNINTSPWFEPDIRLIERTLGVGFFYYGPRLWMVGEVEPLKALQDPASRLSITSRILQQYPAKLLRDRKSTRLNSSHVSISYAVFCLKKKIIAYDRRDFPAMIEYARKYSSDRKKVSQTGLYGLDLLALAYLKNGNREMFSKLVGVLTN